MHFLNIPLYSCRCYFLQATYRPLLSLFIVAAISALVVSHLFLSLCWRIAKSTALARLYRGRGFLFNSA
jgi:hypothetical protein